MRRKIILGLLIFCGYTLSANAQKPDFDVEKHHKEQADFFAKELGLTDAEKTKFTPLMQEYIHARFELNKEVRDAGRALRTKENKTSADYQKVIDLSLDVKIKEAELQKVYFKKFGEVLPAEKVIKYHKAEWKFMEQAVKHHRRGDDERERGKKK